MNPLSNLARAAADLRDAAVKIENELQHYRNVDMPEDAAELQAINDLIAEARRRLFAAR